MCRHGTIQCGSRCRPLVRLKMRRRLVSVITIKIPYSATRCVFVLSYHGCNVKVEKNISGVRMRKKLLTINGVVKPAQLSIL